MLNKKDGSLPLWSFCALKDHHGFFNYIIVEVIFKGRKVQENVPTSIERRVLRAVGLLTLPFIGTIVIVDSAPYLVIIHQSKGLCTTTQPPLFFTPHNIHTLIFSSFFFVLFLIFFPFNSSFILHINLCKNHFYEKRYSYTM